MARKKGMATGITVAHINVKVSPDTKLFRAELKAELEAIERTMKGNIHIKAHLDSAQARADFQRMKSIMEREGRIKVGVDFGAGGKPDPGSPGGGGGRGGGGSGGTDDGKGSKTLGFLNSLTSNIKAPSFGTGINPAGYVVILGAITALVAPLIGLISAALLSLPGLVSMLVAPIAAVTLGLDGFKKAAAAIKPQFEDLQARMSQAAETSFGPVLKDIADNIFPKLKQVLPIVTTGLGDMAQGFVNAFKNPENATKWQNATVRIGQAFSNMQPGIDGFTSGFITLIDEFSKKLPGIIEWFNGAGKDFLAEINRMAASGELSKMFDGLGQTIRMIMDMLTNMGKDGLNFISDPAKMQGFLDTLEQIKSLLEGIVELSDRAGKVWGWNPGTWSGRLQRGLGMDDSLKFPGEKGYNVGGDGYKGVEPGKVGVGSGTKAEIDGVNKSLQQVPSAAQQAQSATDLFLSGSATQGPFNTDPFATDANQQGTLPTPASLPPKAVEPPDTAAAEEKLRGYQATAETTMTAAKTAVENATTNVQISPPDFSSFETAISALPDTARTAMSNVAIAVSDGGLQAVTAAGDTGLQCVQALGATVPAFVTIGVEMMNGLAGGIDAGAATAIAAAGNAARSALAAAKNELGIKSPSRKFMEVGDNSMKGLALGMHKGFGPVLDQAKDLAGRVTDAFASGGDPTGFLDGFTNKEVTRMEKVLSFQSKMLGAQAKALERQAKTTKNDALKAQADKIREQQDEINSQKEMLDLTNEFADLNGQGESDWKGPIAKALHSMSMMPTDFIGNVGQQFMGDLGISGGGLMGALTDYGTQLGSSFVFNVGNMEDALTAHQSLLNKQSLGVVGR